MFKIFFSGLILFHDSAAYLVPDAGHTQMLEFKKPPSGCGNFAQKADKCELAINPGQTLSFNVTGAAPTHGMFFERLVPNLKSLAGTGSAFKANNAAKVDVKGGSLDPYGFATVCAYKTPGSTSPTLVDSVATVLWTLPASVTTLKLTVTTNRSPKDYPIPAGVTDIDIVNEATSPSLTHFDHYLHMASVTGKFERQCHDPWAALTRIVATGMKSPMVRLDPATCPPAVFP